MKLILAWFTGNLSLLIRIVSIVVAVALLVFVVWFFWSDLRARNGWKEAKGRIVLLDSVVRLQAAQIAHKDTVIAVLRKQHSDAVELAGQWKSRFEQEASAGDAVVHQLSDTQTKLAYVKALLKNGTLPAGAKIDTSNLNRAGLKTANRLDIATRKLDTLSLAVAYGQVQNDRLRAGLKHAAVRTRQLATLTRVRATGGVWPFNRKRRKQMKQTAADLDSIAREVNRVSDLENELNKWP